MRQYAAQLRVKLARRLLVNSSDRHLLMKCARWGVARASLGLQRSAVCSRALIMSRPSPPFE